MCRLQVFRIFLVIHLVLYYPVHFAVMRHSLAKLFGQDVLQMELKYYIPITVRDCAPPHARAHETHTVHYIRLPAHIGGPKSGLLRSRDGYTAVLRHR